MRLFVWNSILVHHVQKNSLKSFEPFGILIALWKEIGIWIEKGLKKISLGYKPILHRSFKLLENFAASFGALYFIGGLRVTFSYGISGGGPLALWINWLITVVFTIITAAMLAEICSALPVAGSIYFWAAESAGKRFGRFAGFLVAWWTTTAWISFVAFNSQGAANYLLSELNVFQISINRIESLNYTDVHYRSLAWIVSEGFLLVAILLNYLPIRAYKWLLRATLFMVFFDFLLNVIWLPIGVAKTFGFREKEFLTTSYYGYEGTSQGWSWCLGFLGTASVLVGFDAAGHVAEETKDASKQAARGLFYSATMAAILGIPVVFLFLMCYPPADILATFDAPQPFVPLYALALGNGGHIFMNIICIITLVLNTAVAILAASRLVFAIARDGVLPGSKWLGTANKSGVPMNAITLVGVIAGVLLITIIPSQVAFISLVSAATVPTLGAYALIAFCRLVFTRGEFLDGKWNLGPFWSPIFCFIAVIWNLFGIAVLVSPYAFPTKADTFNYAPVIWGAVTVFAVISYFVIPEKIWFDSRRLLLKTQEETKSKELKKPLQSEI